jgi:pyrrolysine biosynthesis protein PylC
MLIAVVGGKLQGVEATYLAHKAGWQVQLIDINPAVPASGLCDFFVPMDITDEGWLDPVLKDVDMIIPALENREVLDTLFRGCCAAGIPLAFDVDAYAVSSSKPESNRLFKRVGIPMPAPWPECGFPVVAKPGSGSGSEEVRIFHNQQQLEERFSHSLPPGGWVLQEYMEGPCYSLEVVGVPGDYMPLQVTDLAMDAGYDCKRVSAPTQLSSQQVEQFKKIAVTIAEAIQLKGLMDVEVILHNGQLKILEIDARLPSQTPTVVYKSTGCNILQLLAQYSFNNKKFCGGPGGSFSKAPPGRRRHHLLTGIRGVVYEHIKVSSDTIEVCGEHIMAHAGPLHLLTDFFGADEAITNYAPNRTDWVATLIITGAHREEVWEKRNRIIEGIKAHFQLDKYLDPYPEGGRLASRGPAKERKPPHDPSETR